MSRSIHFSRCLAVVLMAASLPCLPAGVQMWTDAQGNKHYGDSPPPGSTTQSVRVNAPPPSRNPAPVYTPPPSAAPPAASRSDEADKRNRDGFAAMDAARARTEALNNKALLEKCRAQRNAYCDEGASTIRQKNYEREQMQAAAQQGAAIAQGRVIPPGQRITPTAPCQWPQTCTGKK